MTGRVRVLTLLIAAASLGVPAAADAAVRYAAPDGTYAEPCTEAQPCGLPKAVNSAATDDEIVVLPGSHTTTALVPTGTSLDIHGVPGQPRPVITSSVTGGGSALRMPPDSTLRYVELRVPGSGGHGVNAEDSEVSDVVIVMSPGAGTGVTLVRDSVLRDAVIWQRSTSTAVGVSGYSRTTDVVARLRNVTAVGESGALYVSANSGTGAVTADVRSSILRGGGSDVRAATGTSAAIDHSSFVETEGAVTLGEGNQSATAPAFVDAAAGDFRQAPTSPTIDAGVADLYSGLHDPWGDPRPLGAAMDIGADELTAAPDVSSVTVSAVGQTTARVTGTVAPRGAATTYRFRYGAALERETAPAGAGTGLAHAPVTADLTGLQAATTYRVQLVAVNAYGTTTGPESTFTTAATPPPDTPSGEQPKPPQQQPPPQQQTPLTPTPAPQRASTAPLTDRIAPVLGSLRIARTMSLRRGTTLRFTLSEHATVTLTVQRLKGARRIAAGTLTRRLPAGAVTLKLGRRIGKRSLTPGRHRLTVTATDAAGNRSAARTVTITVRA